jgi:hypothetical protein
VNKSDHLTCRLQGIINQYPHSPWITGVAKDALAELSQLRTAHDAAVEQLKQDLTGARLTCSQQQDRAILAEAERDAALATGREQGAQGAADLMWGWGFSATIPREERKALYEAILAAIPAGQPTPSPDVVTALREMIALWERVHSPDVMLGKPTVNAAKKALAAIPSPPKGCEWKQGAEHMRTSCGETVSGHYGQAHCPYCGLPISIKAEEGKP